MYQIADAKPSPIPRAGQAALPRFDTWSGFVVCAVARGHVPPERMVEAILRDLEAEATT